MSKAISEWEAAWLAAGVAVAVWVAAVAVWAVVVAVWVAVAAADPVLALTFDCQPDLTRHPAMTGASHTIAKTLQEKVKHHARSSGKRKA
jgi:hypothetical protein